MKAGDSPITKLDVKTQINITRILLNKFPNHYVLGEESKDVEKEDPELYEMNKKNY